MPPSPHSPDVQIRRATQSDHPGVLAALTDAFHQDRGIRSFLAHTGCSDARAFTSALFKLQIDGFYAKEGHIDVATIDGEVVGTALWAPPGKSQSLFNLLGQVPSYAKTLGTASLFAIRREMTIGKSHPAFPHWYLFSIGVASHAQGAGIGSKLIKRGLERAGDNAAYLEASTPNSAALYRRHGFIDLWPLNIPGDKLSEPPELAMWRPGNDPR